MKKLQIDQKASQQAKADSHKKYPEIGILVLCLLLGCGVAVSVVLLGSGIGRFSRKDVNVISLVPPEAADPESQGKGADDSSKVKAKPAQEENSAAGSAVSSRHRAGTTRYTAGKSGKHRGKLKVYDDVRTWSSETWVDLFKNSYDGTVESGDGEKVIAPGTSNFYDFTLKNNGNIALDYSVSLKVETYLAKQDTYSSIPLEWRLLAGDGTVISDWQGYNESTRVLKQSTLKVRHQDNYTVEWRWDFERGEGMDEADTDMGNMAVAQPLGVNAAIYVYAEQNADQNGKQPDSGDVTKVIDRDDKLSGFKVSPKTGDTFHILLYIVMMAISACGMLVFFVMNRGRKTDEDVKNDRK